MQKKTLNLAEPVSRGLRPSRDAGRPYRPNPFNNSMLCIKGADSLQWAKILGFGPENSIWSSKNLGGLKHYYYSIK